MSGLPQGRNLKDQIWSFKFAKSSGLFFFLHALWFFIVENYIFEYCVVITMKVRIFTFPKICWVLFFVVGFWRLWLPVCWLLKLFFAKDVPWRVWWLLFVYSQLRVCACSVVSDSLRLCGLWSARILCPWDSPGKNTGVSCHFLLQGIFPTEESNRHLPAFAALQADSLPLSHWGGSVFS